MRPDLYFLYWGPYAHVNILGLAQYFHTHKYVTHASCPTPLVLTLAVTVSWMMAVLNEDNDWKSFTPIEWCSTGEFQLVDTSGTSECIESVLIIDDISFAETSNRPRNLVNIVVGKYWAGSSKIFEVTEWVIAQVIEIWLTCISTA